MLPASLLELVLQHLALAEQLNHCTHLCKHSPLPSITTIRYTTVLLNDDTVWRISRSPRLLALLSTATSVVLQLDTIPNKSRVLQFVLDVSKVDVLFPQLAHFSYRLDAAAADDPMGRVTRESLGQYSWLPLLPFLSARSATLHSLRLSQPPSIHDPPQAFELPSLVAPLSSLRRLRVAGLRLSVECLPPVLALSLEVLDLERCELHNIHRTALPPSTASVSECVLLRSCRSLHLPPPKYLDLSWTNCIESLVTAQTGSSHPQTLSVRHMLSAAAVQQLVDLPPSCCLSVHLDAAEAGKEMFLSRAVASPRFVDTPRQLRVSLACQNWYKRSNTQPFVSFVAAHHSRIHTIELTRLPQLLEMTIAALSVVSHCANLRSLRLSAGHDRRTRTAVGYEVEAQWVEQPRHDHLHTLKLVGLRDEHDNVCRLLSSCPALRVCTLDRVDVSVAMLSALATSCPLLSHLQLVGIRQGSQLIGKAASTDGLQAQPATPFRSLVQFDLHYSAGHRSAPANMHMLNGLHPFLSGSSLRRLTLVLQDWAYYQPCLTALLAVAPTVESVTVTTGLAEALVEAQPLVTDWSDEQVDDERPALTMPPLRPNTHSPPFTRAQPSNQPSTSSLVKLELVVMWKLLPVDRLAALLSRCPALTSIRLNIHEQNRFELAERDPLPVTLLRCLVTIGQHCPLIEHISFRFHYDMPPPAGAVCVLGVQEARGVVDACQLPDGAFAHLQRVREVGGGVDVLSNEAAEYVRQRWLSGGRGSVCLDWNTHPS